MFNMTVSEAMRRMEVNRATMRRTDGNERVVYLNEWTKAEREAKGYFTDDLEDAVLTAGAMRRSQDALDRAGMPKAA